MNTTAAILQVIIVFDLFLMGIAIYCTFKFFRIANKCVLVIYEEDKLLYKVIIGGSSSSWIERKTYSIRDFSIWVNIYKMLYRGGNIEEVVGKNIRLRFLQYFYGSFISYVLALIIGVSLVFTGFVLSHQ